MSARRLSLAFTIRARNDHQQILVYTLETWGHEQLERYELLLDEANRQIQMFPDSGRACPELLAEGRCQRAGLHMIYYTVAADVVTIHRILH